MEDTHICHPKLATDVSLFGVFDGHGGKLILIKMFNTYITINFCNLRFLLNIF